MYAVIRTGGKQYRVAANDVLEIEKLPGKAGDIVAFGEVLMLGTDGDLKVGTPAVDGHMFREIVDQHRDKIIISRSAAARTTGAAMAAASLDHGAHS
jgi:large subunit ribosomal protein L21